MALLDAWDRIVQDLFLIGEHRVQHELLIVVPEGVSNLKLPDFDPVLPLMNAVVLFAHHPFSLFLLPLSHLR